MINLPVGFLNKIKPVLGDGYDAFLDCINQPPPVSLRINPMKRIHAFDSYDKVAWASDAYYLPERISFTLDPLFHGGCYYVQEASSMFLESALKQVLIPGTPVKLLDLCAAPGGKSTHILSTLPGGSLLVSNEVIASRNTVLHQNLTKWGYSNVVVTQNEASDFSRMPGFFDVIVADAPCSGEGLFRKQPDAVDEWSEDAVAVCATRQRAILDDIYDSLKEGGYLIYSTCTFEQSENDNQVSRLMEQYGMKLVTLECNISGIQRGKYGLHFWPHRIKGEGFFISVLKKTAPVQMVNFKSKSGAVISDGLHLQSMVDVPSKFSLIKKKDELFALPNEHQHDISILMERLYVRKAGIHLGTVKGKDLVPGHEMALSLHLNPQIERVELSREDAIRYLRCETISVKDIPKGWAVVTFQNFPLGWIKGIGNRINNYFPRSLRVLKSQ